MPTFYFLPISRNLRVLVVILGGRYVQMITDYMGGDPRPPKVIVIVNVIYGWPLKSVWDNIYVEGSVSLRKFKMIWKPIAKESFCEMICGQIKII